MSPLLAFGDSKLARGIRGRREADRRLAGWGAEARDDTRPTVWFHAPSVGEGLQAGAAIRALRSVRDDVQVAYTFFSPSAEGWAAGVGADVTDYLPWDLVGPVSRVLDAVRPEAIVFTKTEVWPVLAAQASRRGIPLAIVGATVPEDAGRTRAAARALLGDSWASLSLACANTEADARGLASLGVPEAAIRVTGDPGIDSAVRRFAKMAGDAPWIAPFSDPSRPTVVAGSTWPADEAVLLPALDEVRRSVPDVRLVIAPHEPDASHLDPLVRDLRRDGWATSTLGEVEGRGSAGGADAVVVDRVGVLAQLYGVGAVAYVGGGFHDDGLHSVLEPAAAGLPVVFGPRHRNSRAAEELLRTGGARLATDPTSLARVVTAWLSDEPKRKSAGTLAAGYIEEHRGAATRTAAALATLLDL